MSHTILIQVAYVIAILGTGLLTFSTFLRLAKPRPMGGD